MKGLRDRDTLVFREARSRHLPVAVTLAGGYARNVADTVQIHVNTVLAARDVVADPTDESKRDPSLRSE